MYATLVDIFELEYTRDIEPITPKNGNIQLINNEIIVSILNGSLNANFKSFFKKPNIENTNKININVPKIP